MWFVPVQPVFVDGRVEAYPVALLERSRQADLHGDYKRLFGDFGIRCAVVPTGSPMDEALRMDPSMLMWFSDAQWTVFAIRPTSHHRDRGSR